MNQPQLGGEVVDNAHRQLQHPDDSSPSVQLPLDDLVAPVPLFGAENQDTVSPCRDSVGEFVEVRILPNVDRGEEVTTFNTPEYFLHSQDAGASLYSTPEIPYCQFVAAVNLPSVERVELLLFESPNAINPAETFDMREAAAFTYREGRRYTIGVGNVTPGTLYAFRVHQRDEVGSRVHILQDAYARGVVSGFDAPSADDVQPVTVVSPPKSVLVDTIGVALERSRISPLVAPLSTEESSFYQIDIQSFTEQFRENDFTPDYKRSAGTVKALGDPSVIAYLKSLRVNCVQLSSLQRPSELGDIANPFALNEKLFVAQGAESQLAELREVVSRLHDAGIKVFGNIQLPMWSARWQDASELSPKEVVALAKEITNWSLIIGFDGLAVANGGELGRRLDGSFDPEGSSVLGAVKSVFAEHGATLLVEPLQRLSEHTVNLEDQFAQGVVEQRATTGQAFEAFLSNQRVFPVDSSLPTILAVAARTIPSDRSVHSISTPVQLKRSEPSAAQLRALVAHAVLTPGAFSVRQGQEFAHEGQLTGSGSAFDWYPNAEQLVALNFVQHLQQFKTTILALRYGKFDLARSSHEPHYQFMKADGSLYADLPEFAQKLGLDNDLFSSQDSHCFGVVYSKNKGGLRDFIRNPIELPAPALVVRRSGLGVSAIHLPATPGWEWVKTFDSYTQPGENFLLSPVTTRYNMRQFDVLQGAGVAVYQLSRVVS